MSGGGTIYHVRGTTCPKIGYVVRRNRKRGTKYTATDLVSFNSTQPTLRGPIPQRVQNRHIYRYMEQRSNRFKFGMCHVTMKRGLYLMICSVR